MRSRDGGFCQIYWVILIGRDLRGLRYLRQAAGMVGVVAFSDGQPVREQLAGGDVDERRQPFWDRRGDADGGLAAGEKRGVVRKGDYGGMVRAQGFREPLHGIVRFAVRRDHDDGIALVDQRDRTVHEIGGREALGADQAGLGQFQRHFRGGTMIVAASDDDAIGHVLVSAYKLLDRAVEFQCPLNGVRGAAQMLEPFGMIVC